MALHVLDEANRCLGCKKPMCQQGCPIHTNIPEVIRLLKDNHLDDAGRMQWPSHWFSWLHTRLHTVVRGLFSNSIRPASSR